MHSEGRPQLQDDSSWRAVQVTSVAMNEIPQECMNLRTQLQIPTHVRGKQIQRTYRQMNVPVHARIATSGMCMTECKRYGELQHGQMRTNRQRRGQVLYSTPINSGWEITVPSPMMKQDLLQPTVQKAGIVQEGSK